MHRRTGSLRALAVVACCATTLGGCAGGGGGGDGAGPTSPPPTTIEAGTGGTSSATAAPASTTTTTAAPPRGLEAEVLAAHQGFWDTWLAANDPPDPDHPGLRRYATGDAYEAVVDAIRANEENLSTVRLPDNSRWAHRIVGYTIAGERTRLLRDCVHDDSIKIDQGTGEVIDDREMTFLMEATVEHHEGTWKVSLNTIRREWKGIVNCVTDQPM